MRQSSTRFKQHKVKQPVEGPGHSNVAVPVGEVMSTELAMKVDHGVHKYLLVHSLPDQFYPMTWVGRLAIPEIGV